MLISYKPNGRFGNNLFQYFTTKVIGKLYNKEYRYNQNYIDKIYEININDYNKIKNMQNITLDGYFQINFLHNQKEFINSLLTLDNLDRINNNYTIKEIAEKKSLITEDDLDILKESIVVHIRLDDFFHMGYNSEVINPYYLKNMIISMNPKRVIYVVDELQEEWEKDYMNILLEVENSFMARDIVKNCCFFKDFYLIHNAETVILSRSTFGWISVLSSIKNKNI